MSAVQPARALCAAWTGGGVVMAITGAIGLAAAIGPRLVVGALGGWLAVHVLALPASGFVAVVAASLVVHGLVVAGAIRLGSWSR